MVSIGSPIEVEINARLSSFDRSIQGTLYFRELQCMDRVEVGGYEIVSFDSITPVSY